MENVQVVQQFAAKLGLHGESAIIEKAQEMLRLLELKGTSLAHIGDYARSVICLDLSSTLYGHEFDSQIALKLSGFKRPSYANTRRIIEKLLGLSKPMGVSEICVQLGLTEIQAASTDILNLFVSSSDLRNIDTTHPQYASMAVYQMCKLKKIKIQKSKLISYSHLKTSQWALLEKSWEAWAKKYEEQLKQFQAANKKNAAAVTNHYSPEPVKDPHTDDTKEEHAQPPTEEYSVWRERVLEKAFRELQPVQNSVK